MKTKQITNEAPNAIRVQKLMASLGLSSRREAEAWITEGRVAINGKIVEKMGEKLDPTRDSLYVDGKKIPLKAPNYHYLLVNKPKGYLCVSHREGDQRTIFDLDSLRGLEQKLLSAGRLDYHSEGLVIVSNDGELIHRLSQSNYDIAKRYLVYASYRLDEKDLTRMRTGKLKDDGKPLKKITIDEYTPGRQLSKPQDRQKNRCWYVVTVHDSGNQLVRKIFAAVNCHVFRLIRVGFADIALPKTLKKGDIMPLTHRQVASLKKIVHLTN